ncbi:MULTISPECIES: restriction endonuclease subunit S [Pseudomonadati]|uniref:Restriction endonuclease subunit S n=1 Tax=Shewanella aestuarii TaxID=1028752 RepID=A0ABT0KX41_9GAMM|nr:restriction endonuclease subunit S [Shewanella aestuarii]MCL1116037.1 restriction endonuclease subunit S [Shewanella aestuarii]GGN70093.1 type I restriction endonuclease EcoAI subunit S [Shewanella aestuarii]
MTDLTPPTHQAPTAASLITDHIDIWTSAIEQKSSAGRGTSNKFSLYGIKKLRELILELAVRGKLVPQDPNDEPASVLLERIAVEKAQLVKEGKLKKQKPLPEIGEDEKPFELPQGWEWSRLNDVYDVRDGTHSTPKYQDSGYPLVTSKNLSSGRLDLRDVKFISEEDHIEIAQRSNVDKNDILFAMIGSIGNAVIVDTDIDFSIKNVALFKYYSKNLASPEYLLRFLSFAEIKFKLEASGAVQSFVSLGKVRSFIIALPPLEEQHRIVAKVDELMLLCDALEAQTESSISAHQTLVETLLNALLLPNTTQQVPMNASNTLADSLAPAFDNSDANSPEPSLANNFDKAWLRIAEHFDTLFTTAASIDTLKQTILQLAVMGKLVPQNVNDEPAAKLLERIAKEKAQLIKDGKIKKQKPLPPITDEEKPFELPKGWAYERIGTFGIVGTGATPSRSNPLYWDPAEVNWVSSGETSDFFVAQTKEKVSKLAIKETNVSIYPVGTLIVAMYGQGKTRGQITELLEPAGTNQACAAIRLVDKSINHKDYVKLFFRKAYLELREHAAGGAQPNLNVGKIAATIVPIPPLEEQHRIVAKVDELMALCDQLKARLSNAQTTQLHLTDAIVEQVTGNVINNNKNEIQEEVPMKIITPLTTTSEFHGQSEALLAGIIRTLDDADAKSVWSKSGLTLPDFYKQLKKEIDAGFVNLPSKADFL